MSALAQQMAQATSADGSSSPAATTWTATVLWDYVNNRRKIIG
ncbi:MAG: hypothetical protein R3C45_10100 [Phycisphaerales bacterium]